MNSLCDPRIYFPSGRKLFLSVQDITSAPQNDDVLCSQAPRGPQKPSQGNPATPGERKVASPQIGCEACHSRGLVEMMTDFPLWVIQDARQFCAKIRQSMNGHSAWSAAVRLPQKSVLHGCVVNRIRRLQLVKGPKSRGSHIQDLLQLPWSAEQPPWLLPQV